MIRSLHYFYLTPYQSLTLHIACRQPQLVDVDVPIFADSKLSRFGFQNGRKRRAFRPTNELRVFVIFGGGVVVVMITVRPENVLAVIWMRVGAERGGG